MSNITIPLKERIIVALDVDSPDQAKDIVKKCESHISFFKVGLQLFMGSWFETVDWIVDRGHKVMLDLKFFDIPETVKLAVEQVNSRGVSFATIHGNDPIIRAAVSARGDMQLLGGDCSHQFWRRGYAGDGNDPIGGGSCLFSGQKSIGTGM